MNALASFRRITISTTQQYGLLALLLALIALGPALAGTDITFNPILNEVTKWAEGSLGKLLALAAFIIGMGIGLVRQSVMAVVVGLAFAMVMAYGPTIIGSIVTFAI